MVAHWYVIVSGSEGSRLKPQLKQKIFELEMMHDCFGSKYAYYCLCMFMAIDHGSWAFLMKLAGLELLM